MKKASIALTRAEPGRTSATIPQIFSTTTDASGRFAMKDLEPGTYRLVASRSGFVTAQYGARSPSRPGTPLVISRGEQPKDIEIRLTPHGVVTGRIVDEDGEPAMNMMIQVLKLQYSGGKKQLQPAGMGQTNDLGEYRVFGLAPGKYYVCAGATLSSAPTVDRSATPKPDEDYVPTYYPGVTDPAVAVPVDVSAGAPLRGIDLALAKWRTVRVRGRVSGPAPPTMLYLAPRTMSGALSLRMVRPDGNGAFEVTGVAPGAYTLAAMVQQSGKPYSASMPVEVGQTDVEGLMLTLSAAAAVPGRLLAEGDGKVELSSVGIRLQPRDLGYGPLMMASLAAIASGANAGLAKPGEDGSFRLEDVNAGRYDVAVAGLPSGFYVKSIRSGDSDALIEGLNVTGAGSEPVEIVVSPGAAQAFGVARNPKTGKPAPSAIVALVPQEKERSGVAAFYRQVNTDANGSFRLQELPPGEYRLFAWEDVESGAWMDADFMRPLADRGQRVTLREGDRKTVELNLIEADAPVAR